MRYWECILDTPAEEIDSRCEDLANLGVGGFVVENENDFRSFLENNRQYWDYVDRELEDQYAGVSRLKFYLTDDEDGNRILRQVQSFYPTVAVSVIEDSDWENNWREYYKPIEVGRHLIVVPEWEQLSEGDRCPLILDPGLIFGTGSHATTRMCLQALEDYTAAGKRVLDLGCGSGILGIGALVLGCKSCIGCDIDPKAPDVVMSNAALNGFDEPQIRVYAGDLLADASLRRSFGSGFDIVLANIVADVIIPLSAYVPDFIRPDGVYITSGIIEGRQDEVQAAIEHAGFRIMDHLCEEDWHCFVAKPL